MRQANTTFVNLRAALDDLDPLVETAKPATKDLAPFLAELRPVLSKFRPVLRNLRLTVDRPGFANDAAELLATMPTVESRASATFPHAEDAIAGFQPNLNFARSYTTDLFNALGKLGAAAGYYDGNGNYVRASPSGLNIFENEGGVLKPISRKEQFDFFGSEAGVRKPCPGGATQNATDGSSPYINPPQTGSAVSPSECDPSDVPPGP
jgi:phospholipid/cholesterol/gamma-HCH transport system substrate-binding protein